MKIAYVGRGTQIAPAVLIGDRAHLIAPWVEGSIPASAVPVRRSLASLQESLKDAREVVPLADVRLLPPAGLGSKFICLGLNYRNHVEEIHRDLPEDPSLFVKLADALVGQNEPVIRPRVSECFDYEGEISVVIGTGGRHISREDALSHIFGYTIMLDGSVRDYQKHSVSAGKNFWRSGSLGPWIVTRDEIPDPTRLKLETRLNGQIVQSTTADLMIYDIPTAIAYISRWIPLGPGDVIATGTPGGVGSRRTPPLWMKDGDTIEVEVSGIGVLRNPVRDEVSLGNPASEDRGETPVVAAS
jgi:2-keto-4-pentenoate hydratase/2-oxohepta-3-ene-1,7-dioic acid hydratase in catechol pathway